jgi:ABC-type multidrug transport system fused ATPase/permease subunit
MLRVIDTVPEIDADSTEGKLLKREEVKGDLAFENVHFRYPTRPGVRVLRGLDLKLPAGMSVALVGASGVSSRPYTDHTIVLTYLATAHHAVRKIYYNRSR